MSSSNIDVPQPKSRDNSADQQQRYGASAYIDQSEYDSYKQSTITKHDGGGNRGAYSNYPTDNNNNNNNRNRYVQDTTDDDYTTTVTNSDYSSGQPYYNTKNSSTTSYSGLLNRSNSYNGLQPRVISAKQRNTSGSSLLYQVNNFNKKFLNRFVYFRNLITEH
jgi:hypothetical protein